MAVSLENPAHRAQDPLVVVHDENPQALYRSRRYGVRFHQRAHGNGGGEYQTYRGAAAWCAVNLNPRSMPLNHAVHHRKSQPGAALSLGGKERLHTLAPYFLRHAIARIAYVHPHVRRRRTCAVLSKFSG